MAPLPAAGRRGEVARGGAPGAGALLRGHRPRRRLPLDGRRPELERAAGRSALPGLLRHLARPRPAARRDRLGRPHRRRPGRAPGPLRRRRPHLDRREAVGGAGRGARRGGHRPAGAGRSSPSGARRGSRSPRTTASRWRPSHPPLDPGSGVSFLAFHPPEARRPLHGLVPPPVPLDGPRPHVDADRRRDGRGHAGLRSRLLADRPGRHLGRDLRLGLPDDRRGRELEAVQGRPRPTGGRRPCARDPRDPSRVLAGTTGGLFESRDAGAELPASSRSDDGRQRAPLRPREPGGPPRGDRDRRES